QSPRLICSITANAAQQVMVQARATNLGRGFYQPLALGTDIVLRQGALDGPQLVHALDATGDGVIVLTGALAATGTLTVEFLHPPVPTDWAGLQPELDYVPANRWHELLYYKVAPPFLPGGDRKCGDCLQI